MTEVFRVEHVEGSWLLDLRRRVLRGNDPESSVDNPHDAEPTTLHLGGFLDGRLVVCASFYASTSPVHEGVDAHQLRYMATDESVQGRGLGTRVLERAFADLHALGEVEVWAKARDSALGFYRATGWIVVEGSEHVSVETDLPHTVIWRPLTGSSARD